MPVSAQTYERIAMEDPEGQWELVCGRLRQKPPMTMEHNLTAARLHRRLQLQLDEDAFLISSNATKLRISTGSFYMPDVCVVPMTMVRALLERRGTFEVHEEPVPLVVEVWSPSTGDYDVDTKFPEYRLRGDAEIWRIHPYEHTLTAWRRRADGSYTEQIYTTGTIRPIALPGVSIIIDELFA